MLWQLPAVDILRRVWLQQLGGGGPAQLARGESGRTIAFCAAHQFPLRRRSALQSQAHDHVGGVKVHLSETCEADHLHLITQVATTVSTEADSRTLPHIQQGLADQSLLPSQQLVDTAYVSDELLVQSHQLHVVELVGPACKDQKWQALAGQGYAAADFDVDWDAQQATRPQGIRLAPGSIRWKRVSPACLSSSPPSSAGPAPFGRSVRG